MKQIMPYPVLAGAVIMTVREVRLDDVALPYGVISEQDHSVGLHAHDGENWSAIRLGLQVVAPRHELDANPWYSVAFLGIASERATNTQTAVKFMMGQPGEWSGEIELHHDNHRGRVQLSGQLVATVDDIPGRVIATVERPWTVDLRTRAATREDSIETRWTNFADDPELAWCRNDPWTVTTTDHVATLYLNSGFDGLRAVLESTKAVDRPTRDVLASQIAAGMWTALFSEAAQHVDGTELPNGWRGLVLRRMLPDLFPHHSQEDALREILNRGVGGIQPRVQHAAAKQARLPRSLGGLIRSLQKAGREEE
ncbi:hypothetical protein [Nonomuraea endophytica]|uniref:Uncharacterized protein n=1 Tax=Nonomuraea endophytica TaxID=714136 RepID=A0A7W8EDK5_9ACTN|nr:hypothetical protein [Nonomuraea endophytica]MBB5075654.1 hypothetical protein [Nonomuraea endophytica]